MDRTPDTGGYQYWQDRFESGTSMARIGDEFYWSPEMQTHMDVDEDGLVTDDEFVTHLYVNVLNRDLDQDGYDYWLGRLKEGTGQGRILAEFFNGDEFVDNTVDGVVEFVTLTTKIEGASGAPSSPIQNPAPKPQLKKDLT